MRARKFVLHTAINGQPYFTFVAGNGEVLFTSETFSSKDAMMDTLWTLAGHMLSTKVVEHENLTL
jgi:uncharacterized protein YegP (UPF0339 family)